MEKNIELICHTLADKKCVLTKVLNVHDLTSIASYFILTTTRNKKQSQAASDAVEEVLAKQGIKPLRTEGYREGDWILLDFGDVIIHIFTDEERRHYELDNLWKDAPAEEYHESETNNAE